MRKIVRFFLFLAAAAAYPHWVEMVSKWALTTVSLTKPSFVNDWYEWNREMIRAIPYVGERVSAVISTWFSDGDIVTAETWVIAGLPLFLLVYTFDLLFGDKRPKKRPLPEAKVS
jgi:hypothetical protein